MKGSFRNEGKNKTFSDKRELKINSQLTWSIRNAKGSFSGWREMLPEGNRPSNVKEAGYWKQGVCVIWEGLQCATLYYTANLTQSGE